jgi:hypothetical protein
LRTLRSGVRPAYAIRWTRADLALPAHIAMRRVGGPATQRGCDAGPWRVAGSVRLRLVYAGRLGACPGEYAFTIDHVAGFAGSPPVACERLAGSSRGGCAASERLGTLAVPVR